MSDSETPCPVSGRTRSKLKRRCGAVEHRNHSTGSPEDHGDTVRPTDRGGRATHQFSERVALLAANNLQSGRSSASSVPSSMLNLWYDRSFFIVANQEVWGTAVRILLAFANSSILAKWPNSIGHIFWINRGKRWLISYLPHFMIGHMLIPAYAKDPPILLRHHWSSASILLVSASDRDQYPIRTAR